MFPVLLELGPLRIFTYGFFLAIAFLSAIYVSAREAGRLGLPVSRFYDLCFYIVLAALIGSRLAYVFLDLKTFLANPLKIFALWEGGLVFQGGVALAIITALFYMRMHGLPWRTCLDALGLGTPVGQFFGRIGCFMAGCCYGAPSDLPWAVTFLHSQSLCPIKEPIHPAQLYEAFLALGVFGVLNMVKTRKRFDGQLILTYFALAGLVRFTVEFFRHPGDYRGPALFGWMPLTQAVALALAVVCSGLALWWGRRSPGAGRTMER
ncbi:MAG: prolipoprotein diacylglyceryl transferase [Deltaproteobacteria bacterium]|nr:prolipoprotein diacylglyceryl transferase [Deltaproteobacteria bacterium]